MTQPVRKFRAGACSASIFVNESKQKEGESYRRVVVQRVYRDQDGKFQATTSFRLSDIPKVILILQKAYEYLVTPAEQEAGNRSDSSTT